MRISDWSSDVCSSDLIDGSEIFDITGVAGGITPGMDVACTIRRADGSTETIDLLCRIDTLDEVEYYRHGGILHYVLRNLMQGRSEERRVGKECVSTCRSRWSPFH